MNAQLKTRNLGLVRIAWILLALLSVASFIMGLPLQQAKLGTLCPYDQPALDCDTFQMDSDGAARLETLGISLSGYGSIVSSAQAVSEAICFLIAVLIFWRRPRDKMALLVATMLLLANVTVGPTTLVWARLHPGLRILDAFFMQAQPVTVMCFLFLFPDWRFVPRWTVWLFGAAFTMAPVYAAADMGLSSGSLLDPHHNPILETVGGVAWLLAVLSGLGSQIFRYVRRSNLIQRQQTKWVLAGAVASLVLSLPSGFPNRLVQPGSLVHVISVVFNTISFSVIALALSVAIQRHRLWDIEVLVNRALIYGPLSAILAGVFAASVALINQIARESLGAQATTMAALVSALIVASVFQPLRTRIERWINSRWYPDSIDLEREFIEFSPEVRSVIRLGDLLSIVAAKTVGLLGVQYAAILLADPAGDFLRVETYPVGSETIERLKPEASLLMQLQKGHAVPKGNQQGLLVPLYLRRMRSHDVVGILDVGPRRDQHGFSSDDRKALSHLGAEIGTSIYTAQLREKGI